MSLPVRLKFPRGQESLKKSTDFSLEIVTSLYRGKVCTYASSSS